VRWRPSWTAFSFESGPSAIALDVHLDDGGVVNEAIDGGEGHGGVREDPVPFAEWLIGRDQHRASLVACTDEFEQHAGLGLILGDVSEIIKDKKIEAIETIDGRLEVELASRQLELLHEIGGPSEEDAPSVLDQGQADRCRQVALSAAGWTSVIMPGVWDLRWRSFTRSIRDAERQSSLSPASGLGVRRILLSDNLTPR
jgi:hypothetical protein